MPVEDWLALELATTNLENTNRELFTAMAFGGKRINFVPVRVLGRERTKLARSWTLALAALVAAGQTNSHQPAPGSSDDPSTPWGRSRKRALTSTSLPFSMSQERIMVTGVSWRLRAQALVS